MNRAVVLAIMAAGAGAGSQVCGSALAQGIDNDRRVYHGGGVGQFTGLQTTVSNAEITASSDIEFHGNDLHFASTFIWLK